MKTTKKYMILKIIISIIMVLLLLTNISNGRVTIRDDIGGGSPATGGTGGIEIDTGELEGIYGEQDDSFKAKAEKILGVVSYLCYAAAFIVIVYKGVQFMNKAPEAKAELKKELINVAIGAFILVAIGGIIQLISNIAIGPLFN